MDLLRKHDILIYVGKIQSVVDYCSTEYFDINGLLIFYINQSFILNIN